VAGVEETVVVVVVVVGGTVVVVVSCWVGVVCRGCVVVVVGDDGGWLELCRAGGPKKEAEPLVVTMA
jgi:hypothetical protein